MAPAGRHLYFSIGGQKHCDFNQPTFTISFIPTYMYLCSRQSEVMLTSDVHYDTRQFSSDQESCNKMLSSLEVPVNQSDFRIQLIAAAPGSGSKWCRTSISLLTGELVHQLRKNYWKMRSVSENTLTDSEMMPGKYSNLKMRQAVVYSCFWECWYRGPVLPGGGSRAVRENFLKQCVLVSSEKNVIGAGGHWLSPLWNSFIKLKPLSVICTFVFVHIIKSSALLFWVTDKMKTGSSDTIISAKS